MATNKNFVVKNGLEVGGDIVVTGSLQTSGLTLPASDGTSGQVIATDGNGNLSFQTIVSNFTISDGTNTDTFNTGETLTFTAGTGITTTVSNNVVTISGATLYTDADAISAVEGAAHLTIDGGTLYVDTSNNYVGIGDTSPQHKLDVAGGIGINGTEVITSAGTYTGPVLDGSLTVGGSLVGPLSNLKVQYGTAYSGTPAQGSFFFDSLNQKLKVYTGSSFVDAVPAGAGGGGGDLTDAVATFEKFQYTITSQTNAISGSDDNSNTLAYVVDGSQNVEVYVNGVKQYEGATNDYVATTGTSVTFTYNIPSGSVVDIQVYELLSNDAFYLKTETYTQTETNSQIATGLSSYLPLTGGTVSGALSVSGNLTIDTNTLFVDAANNSVGIGTISPSEALEVYGTTPIIQINDRGLYQAQIGLIGNDLEIRGSSGNVEFYTGSADGASSTERMRIDSSGSVGIGPNATNRLALIYDPVSGLATFGPNSTGGNTALSVGTSLAGSFAEHLHITSSGNVGIGTVNPDQKLYVDGTIRAGVAGNSSANLPALKVFSAGTSSTQSAIAIQQGTNEGDTIIFADYDPYVEYGISAVNELDAIDFTGASSTGSIGSSKVFYNNAGEARTAYVKMRVHLNSGLLQVGGDIETTGVFRGKIPFMVVVHNDGERSYPTGNSNVYYNVIRHSAGGVSHNSNYNFTFTHPGYYRMTTTYRYGTGSDVWTTMDLVDGGTILGTGHGTGQTVNDPATNVFDYVVRIDTGNVGRNLQQRVRRLGSGFTIANTNYGDELITIVQWMGSL